MIAKAELQALVKEAQQTGKCPERLAELVVTLCKGLTSDEDIIQGVLVILLRWLTRIDPEKNVFAFLSQVVKKEKMYRARQEELRQKMLYQYAIDMGWWWNKKGARRTPMRFRKRKV